jgi:Kef-type K+ transport system membrane component KefB
MTPFLQLVFALVILILAAKIGGYLSFRLGQPSVLGELLVGIALGPSVLNVLEWGYFSDPHLGETIHHLAEMGVLLLMFLAGLDLHITDLMRSRKVASLAGVLGVVFPMVLSLGLGLAFRMKVEAALFLGLILSATSVSISAQTLMELGKLRSRVGIGLLGAAVFDDILVVLGLSIFTALTGGSAQAGLLGVLWIILRMVLFIVGSYGLGAWILPGSIARVEKMNISKGVVAFALVVALFFAWTAEFLGGMAAITGAFLAGLVFARSRLKERIVTGISTLAYAFFVPIFFINIGLSADARQISPQIFWLFVFMTLLAIVGKVLGSGWGARLGGLSRLEALQIGVGMMSRGEVGLIVASVGVANSLIADDVFAAVVGVVVITTLLTPPILRTLFIERKNPQSDVTDAHAPVESVLIEEEMNVPDGRLDRQ